MGEAALPTSRPTRTLRLSGFAGLDRRGGLRDGGLSVAAGVDPRALPALSTIAAPRAYHKVAGGKTLGFSAVGDILFRVYVQGNALYLSRIHPNGEVSVVTLPSLDHDTPRTILAYNLYTNPEQPLSGYYRRLVLVYPDRIAVEPDASPMTVEPLGTGSLPEIGPACVHLSRVFGTRDDRLYACAFNDPRDWNLDTADDIDPSHAWASTVQSNTRSSGSFTALTVYDGHVLAFKRRFCHILNNNKNPFRVADLLTVGTRDARTLAEVDGKLFFVSDEGVYRYNGERALCLSDVLDVDDFSGALGAGYGGQYYCYLPACACVFVWCEATGAWSELPPFTAAPITAMAAGERGCFLLDETGQIYTTEGGTCTTLSATTAPLVQESLGRLSRVSLALTAEPGATLRLVYCDTRGRETPLLEHRAAGGSLRLESRVFTPTDYGGCLHIEGCGRLTVHDVILRIAEGVS
jgi:hypothetical protein